ncbi:MAG TPA: TatD family hydrolase [Streptosporangiaceae bacterium]
MNAAYPPSPEPLTFPAFDAHTHLDALDMAPEEAVASAAAVGVTRMVTVGCDLPSSRWSVESARLHDAVFAAVAIHPNDTSDITDDTIADIAHLAAEPRVRAVGETGLDYYRDWADPAAQQWSFRAHIEIAKRTGKALMIHDRDAHDDILRILDADGPPEKVIFHCFSGDADMARLCAERGYYMSFAGNVTFTNAAPLREAALAAPPELMLIETDAPYLTPVPHRGKPNAPYLIPYTLRFLAELKGLDPGALARTIDAAGRAVFGDW